MKSALKPYTLTSRSKSQPHEPKLVKEYVCPTAKKRNEYNKNGIQQSV
jgi:hypothetical protein